MSRIRIDPTAIATAQAAVALAETEESETRRILSELEQRKQTIQWGHRQAGYEHHSRTSASGLYMTAYGSSRRHTDRCNQNMDFKERVDQKFEENLADVQKDIKEAEKAHDRAVEKLRQAKETLCSAERGF